MRLIELGIGVTNPTVGAVASNVDALIAAAKAMAASQVTVGCFPEQAVGGYPAEDLVQWQAFVAAQRRELERFALQTASLATVFVVGAIVAVDGQLFNVAAVVHRGRILAFVPKEKLPTYGIFYERRTLSRGSPGLHLDAAGVALGDYIFHFDAFTLAVEVCEDAWTPEGPMRRRCYSGADLVLNISASPYRVGVQDTRREMLATRSADNQCALVYANRVGAQDGLVFDGGGFVFQNGRLVFEGERFRERLATCIIDCDRTTRLRQENTTWRADCEAFQRADRPTQVMRVAKETADRSDLAYPAPNDGGFFLPDDVRAERSAREIVLDEVFEALAYGVKDYLAKTRAFRGMGIALSGGRDSLLTLLVAWRAAQLLREDPSWSGSPTLAAFYMPTRFSGAPARAAAERICAELGVALTTSSIDDAFEREREATRCMLGGEELTAVTLQNIQARLRGERMWNWANSANALFLQTSDMSEKAVGYVTIGGDLEGGLSIIANVPKTVVVAMLQR